MQPLTQNDIAMIGVVEKLEAIEDELRTANLLAYAALLQTQRQHSEGQPREDDEEGYDMEIMTAMDAAAARLVD